MIKKALKLLQEIEDNFEWSAITMDPEEVLNSINELRELLKNIR